MRTIGGATMSSSTDPALSLADRIDFLMPRMTWRDAAIALSMQKVVRLSSLTNLPALHENSCRGTYVLFFYPLVTAQRCHEEECHGSMSYRQDFRRNVAPCTAVPAQEPDSSKTPSRLVEKGDSDIHCMPRGKHFHAIA